MVELGEVEPQQQPHQPLYDHKGGDTPEQGVEYAEVECTGGAVDNAQQGRGSPEEQDPEGDSPELVVLSQEAEQALRSGRAGLGGGGVGGGAVALAAEGAVGGVGVGSGLVLHGDCRVFLGLRNSCRVEWWRRGQMRAVWPCSARFRGVLGGAVRL